MDVPRRFHQQTQTDRFEKSNGYTYPHWCMSWFKMSSPFTVLASHLKPHSPNMFPTSSVARLNWGLEERPRSAWCEKGYWISDGNMRTDEVRNAKYSSSPVLNHPMTWGLALIQEAPVCWNMSKHVPCRSGLRCLLTCNFWCNAKVRDFCSEFWDERTYATSFRYVAADRRGGFLVLRYTLEARRLGWCAFIGFFLGQQPPMEEQGMCYDGIFRGGTGPKTHVVIRISPLRVCTCLHHFGRCLESHGA